ncbi:MAG: hypothetical protein PHQ46_03755 [Negativicutes bacterium]|nr:hypothetical protein [Negativicutes bacterium]
MAKRQRTISHSLAGGSLPFYVKVLRQDRMGINWYAITVFNNSDIMGKFCH